MSADAPTAAPAAAPSTAPAAPAPGGDAAPAPAPAGGAAPAAAQAQPDARAARENRADRHARVLAKVNSKQAQAAPADAPPAATPPGDAAPQAEGEAPAAAKGEPPAATPPQDALSPAQRQAMADAARAEREAWETKQELKRLREETAAAKAADEARKKLSPLELLAKERGISYEQLTKEIVAGKHKELTPEQIALDGQRSELQQLKDELAAIKAEREATQKAKELETNAAKLNEELRQDAHAKRFPVLAAMADAGKRILTLKEQHPDASYEDIATHLETEMRGVQSVDALKARFSADADFKAQVMAALGLTQSSQPAQPVPQGKPRAGNGPDAITATRAADPGARSQPVVDGRSGRIAAALAAVNNKQRASLG